MDRGTGWRAGLVGVAVALLLTTFGWALTRLYVLNFSTAGPNASAALFVLLVTGWTVVLVPRLRARPRAVTAALALALFALVGSVLAAPVPALVAAVVVQLCLLPVVFAVADAGTLPLGGALGVTLFVALRAWQRTVPAYATTAGTAALVGLGVLAFVGWVVGHEQGRLELPAGRTLPAGTLVAFLLGEVLLLGLPGAVATWALRPTVVVTSATVVGLVAGGVLVAWRGPPGDRATVGWVVVFVVALADLLWLDAVAGLSVLPAQLATVALLARGSHPSGDGRPSPSVRRLGASAAAVQLVGFVLLFLHISALNWAFMPAPVDTLTRRRLPWFLFGCCVLLPAVVAVRVLVDRSQTAITPAQSREQAVERGRRSALGLVGAGLVGLGGVVADTVTAREPASPSGPLRVATYNVHQFLAPDGSYNLRALRATLRAVDADVVGLQESASGRVTSGGFDGVAWLAEELGYYHTHGTPTDGGSYGVALLSRWPITSERVVHLPVNRSPPRPALVAEVDAPDGPLPVVVTHFQTAKPGDRRAAEARRIVELTADVPRAVVLGDFNTRADPGEAPYRILDRAFTDAWTAAERRAGGLGTYSASNPRKRIDHVWLRGEWTVTEARTVGGSEVSDHRAVVATLRADGE